MRGCLRDVAQVRVGGHAGGLVVAHIPEFDPVTVVVDGAVIAADRAGIVVRVPGVSDAHHIADGFIHKEEAVGSVGPVGVCVIVDDHQEVGGAIVIVVVVEVKRDPSGTHVDDAVKDLDRRAVDGDEAREHRLLDRHQVEGDVAVAAGGGAMERYGLQVSRRTDFVGREDLLCECIFVDGEIPGGDMVLLSEKQVAAARTGGGETDAFR